MYLICIFTCKEHDRKFDEGELKLDNNNVMSRIGNLKVIRLIGTNVLTDSIYELRNYQIREPNLIYGIVEK